MGEIDTKPIESVQAALCYFGEKYDQRKQRSPTRDLDLEKLKELDEVQKELANCKVQLEVNRSEHMQVLLNIQHYQETVVELSAKLEEREADLGTYRSRLAESRAEVEKLETEICGMADQLSEFLKVKEQLAHVYSELKAAQTELISMAAEFVAVKERGEELQLQVTELNEALYLAKLSVSETEMRHIALLSEKDVEIKVAREDIVQYEEQLENMRNQIEAMQDLEHQLLSKSLFIDSLQSELQRAEEKHSSSEEAAAEAFQTLGDLKSKLEIEESKTSEQLVYIESLYMEQGLLRQELENAKEEGRGLNYLVEEVSNELKEAKFELNETKARETELQVEIAMLKADLHKGRSKIAAAEASETRANYMRSGFSFAIRDLAIEAEEAKRESLKLKEEIDRVANESSDPDLDMRENIYDVNDFSFQAFAVSENVVTISLEEYETLLQRAEKADHVSAVQQEASSTLASDIKNELEVLKKEHEAAKVKIEEFRTRAEQAVTRAESAERAKAAVEDQLRKWREQKQRRKAAYAALKEETLPAQTQPRYDQPVGTYQARPQPRYDQPVGTYQPLGEGEFLISFPHMATKSVPVTQGVARRREPAVTGNCMHQLFSDVKTQN